MRISNLASHSDIEETKKWISLGESVKDIASLIASALFERVYVLTTYSVRAMLKQCRDVESRVCGRALAPFSSLVLQAVR